MKIAIIGANGQLGYDLQRALSSRQVVPLTHGDIEIASPESVEGVMGGIRPHVVINTAAYHKVEDCEAEYARAFMVNAIGPRNLAQTCQKLGATLVHVSTDYVFDGTKGSHYVEEDVPNPLNTYGVTKLAGEYFVRNLCQRHLIVRTSGLYGIVGCRAKGGNFIDTMLKLAQNQSGSGLAQERACPDPPQAEKGAEIKVVDDQIVSPSYTLDVANRIAELLTTGEYGVFHVTNSGQCSWYEFACKIFELAGIRVNLKRTSQEEMRSRIRRPRYSALGSSRFASLGLPPLRPWYEALAAYMEERSARTGELLA
jgi:dTDP-4-dehydrorhamnose reductase